MTAGDELVRAQMVAVLPRLHRFALLLTGSRADADDLVADADDLVQATCERAITRLDGNVDALGHEAERALMLPARRKTA